MIAKDFSLEGKVVVVTGVGRSWLNTIASSLAEVGADIILASQDKKQVDAAVQAAKKWGHKTVSIPTDVTRSRQIEAMAKKVIAGWGKIDVLINSLDLQFAKPLLETSKEEWQKVMNANLSSLFLCTKVVAKYMMGKGGRIINFSSGMAERGVINTAAYASSKGAVEAFTRAAAIEWSRQNITVNAIGLGWFTDEDMAPPEGLTDRLVRYLPLRRLGQPADLAPMVVYLASDASSYVTGQIYYVSGGIMAHG
jgi:NAD(P)-dependent dehydrogenase (short-subunit alcohol dehydrogenase family)